MRVSLLLIFLFLSILNIAVQSYYHRPSLLSSMNVILFSVNETVSWRTYSREFVNLDNCHCTNRE